MSKASFFEWDKSLDVGVDEMNHQHQTLIGLMEALYQKNAQGATKQDLIETTEHLVDFVIKHFKDEENYMALINFPGLEAHRKLHGNLLTDLTKFVNDFKGGTHDKISNEFVTFLKFWLSTHIRGIDTKYGVHARGDF